MLQNWKRTVTGPLLIIAFTIVSFRGELLAEEYVWARFYGSNVPSGYKTNGFGSYYVPKSMVISSELQTDPIKKPADPKPNTIESKASDPVVETHPSKPAPPAKRSLWKRMTFRK